MLRTLVDLMKENDFTLAKARTMVDEDYADDIALLTNTPTKAESLLHSLERIAGGIALHITGDKKSSCALIKEVTSPHKEVDP